MQSRERRRKRWRAIPTVFTAAHEHLLMQPTAPGVSDRAWQQGVSRLPPLRPPAAQQPRCPPRVPPGAAVPTACAGSARLNRERSEANGVPKKHHPTAEKNQTPPARTRAPPHRSAGVRVKINARARSPKCFENPCQLSAFHHPRKPWKIVHEQNPARTRKVMVKKMTIKPSASRLLSVAGWTPAAGGTRATVQPCAGCSFPPSKLSSRFFLWL